MMQEPRSGSHDAQWSSCFFSQDAKRSISVMLKIEHSSSNVSVEIIHSAESWNLQQDQFAATLCLPGIWAADKWGRCFIQISQISIANLLYTGEFLPLVCWRKTEVLSSVIIQRCLVLGNSGRNEKTPCVIATNSSSFMCRNFSHPFYLPLMV